VRFFQNLETQKPLDLMKYKVLRAYPFLAKRNRFTLCRGKAVVEK
jgi:hypothetical protein